MAIEHRLTDADTLQSLALRYLGNADRWKEIVDFNKLSPPYIGKDRSELYDHHASGFLIVTRTSSSHPVTIRKGWTFTTSITMMNQIPKVYEVVEDVVIPAGKDSAYVYVRCTVPGVFGNVMEGAIDTVGQNTLEQAEFSIESVTNPEKFTNGKEYNVRFSGEIIYIPTSEDETGVEDIDQLLANVGGEDFVLDAEGNLFYDNYGDIASVSGVDNIKQAVKDRLMTEKGEYPLHPEYGTNIPSIIGTARTPYTERMVRLEILQALSLEDRIENVQITSLTIEHTTVYVEVSYTVKLTSANESVAVTINGREA